MILISLLLLSCAVHCVSSSEAATKAPLGKSLDSRKIQRRYLLSSISNSGNIAHGNLNIQDTAYRIQVDWLPEEDIPHPELYYQDLATGERQLIWAFDDTLARDVLAGRPDVWLHATFQVERDLDLLLPFLEHYSRLGIDLNRMIFTLIASNLHSKELLHVQKSLRHICAVYSTLLLKPSASLCRSKGCRKAVFEANLRATYSVPVKDWIIDVEGSEFIQFSSSSSSGGSDGVGGSNNSGLETDRNLNNVSAEEFFETLELQGINWVAGLPIERFSSSGSFEKINGSGGRSGARGLALQFPLKCQFSSSFGLENRTKVVVYRGYLRPDMPRRSIIPAEEAKSYFSALRREVKINAAGGDSDSIDFLYNLTPYSRYWEFFKTPLMVGNVYLWSQRGADSSSNTIASIHRFRWHASRMSSAKEVDVLLYDEEVEEYEAMGRVIKAGKMDLTGEGDDKSMQCEKPEDGMVIKKLLPLKKDAALSLAALKSLY